MNLLEEAIRLEKQAGYAYDLYDAPTVSVNHSGGLFDKGSLLKDVGIGSLTGAGLLGWYALASLASKGRLAGRLSKLLRGEKKGLLKLLTKAPKEVSESVMEGLNAYSPGNAGNYFKRALGMGGILGGISGAAMNAADHSL